MKTTEASIQSTLKHALETCGYFVGEINKGRKAGSTGYFQTVGLPDLIVTHDDWHDAMWIGIELKTATGKLRPEQAALHARGRIIVCRSVAEGIEAVLDVDSIEGRSAWNDPAKLRRMKREFLDNGYKTVYTPQRGDLHTRSVESMETEDSDSPTPVHPPSRVTHGGGK